MNETRAGTAKKVFLFPRRNVWTPKRDERERARVTPMTRARVGAKQTPSRVSVKAYEAYLLDGMTKKTE